MSFIFVLVICACPHMICRTAFAGNAMRSDVHETSQFGKAMMRAAYFRRRYESATAATASTIQIATMIAAAIPCVQGKRLRT